MFQETNLHDCEQRRAVASNTKNPGSYAPSTAKSSLVLHVEAPAKSWDDQVEEQLAIFNDDTSNGKPPVVRVFLF